MLKNDLKIKKKKNGRSLCWEDLIQAIGAFHLHQKIWNMFLRSHMCHRNGQQTFECFPICFKICHSLA
jgi:hypothetical protein